MKAHRANESLKGRIKAKICRCVCVIVVVVVMIFTTKYKDNVPYTVRTGTAVPLMERSQLPLRKIAYLHFAH